MLYRYGRHRFTIPGNSKIMLDAGIFLLIYTSPNQVLANEVRDFLKDLVRVKKCELYTNILSYSEVVNRLSGTYFASDLIYYLAPFSGELPLNNPANISDLVAGLKDTTGLIGWRLEKHQKFVDYLATGDTKYFSPKEFYQALCKSPSHRKAMNRYEYMAMQAVESIQSVGKVDLLLVDKKIVGLAKRLMWGQDILYNDALIFETYQQGNMTYFFTTDSDYDRLSNITPTTQIVRFDVK